MFNNELWQKPAGAAGGGGFYDYQIASSIRNSSAQDGTLKWTAGTPTSSTKFTMSYWVKRYNDSGGSSDNLVFTSGSGGGSYIFWGFSTAYFDLQPAGGNWTTSYLKSNNAYRDTSAWYHHVLTFDSTQSTQADRLRIYVNGERITSFSVESVTAGIGASESFSFINQSGIVQAFGGLSGSGHGTEGADNQMAEIVFNDGQSYGPDSYGETKNGVWIPKDPSGLTFGNNGYYLKMAEGAIGTDSSGNGNNFTVANISPHDVMLDSPTFNSNSNGGNFCTYNPLTAGSYISLSEGNLQTIGTNVGDEGCVLGTMGVTSGKWYWEVRMINMRYSTPGPGISAGSASATQATGTGGPRNLLYYAGNSSNFLRDFNSTIWGTITEVETGLAGFSAGHIMMIALDVDNKKVWYGKNGSWFTNSGNPATGANPQQSWTGTGFSIHPAIQEYDSSSSSSSCANFGSDGSFAGAVTAQGNSDDTGYGDFYYNPKTIASGFLALCAGNLPIDATVDPAQTDDNFAKKLFGSWRYTGNNGARTISTIGENGFGIKQDLHIIRSDIYAQTPYWMNTTEGIFGASSNNYYIGSDGTSAQATLPQYNFVSQSETNYNLTGGTWFNSGATPVVGIGWRFNGGTTVSNGNGDLTSTVQLDSSTCASIVTYTGTLSSSGVQTVGHGLSKAPNYIITKGLGKSGNWWVWSDSQTSWNYGMNLNNSNVSVDKSGNGSMSAPTSTVFSTNYTDGINDGAGSKMIAYCFANCPGYIHSGKYVGNGNTDGSFVYTGFKPAFVMVKYIGNNHSGAAGESWSYSNANSSPINPVQKRLSMNSSNAQSDSSTFELDYLSNGFKMRTTWEGYNGNNYIISYIAFAENSFKYATAR